MNKAIAKKAPAAKSQRHIPNGALNIDLEALQRAGFETSIDGPIVSIMGTGELDDASFDAWQMFTNTIGLPPDEAEDFLCDILDAAMWHHVRAALSRR